MAFIPTLVAMPEDATSYPYLGFPLTAVRLAEPSVLSVNAGIPQAVGFDSRDRVTEGTDGSDAKVARRKLAFLEMTVDYVDAATKAEIERLIHDSRTVFFCPNVGPDTLWSFPLLRSLDDFMGRRTVALSRVSDAFLWDATDRVFRVVAANQPQFGFRGAWSRYLRTQSLQNNLAIKPHPDSTGTGWAVIVGSATIVYTEDILTPVLAKRGVTNGKGVASITGMTAVTTIGQFSTGTGSATNKVVASVAMAWTGTLSLSLQNAAGTVTYDSVTAGVGDGKTQLLKLGGDNTDGATSYRLIVTITPPAGSSATAIVGPVFIGSDDVAGTRTPKIVDWSEAASDRDSIINTDTVTDRHTEATFSWFGKWVNNDICFVTVGGGSGGYTLRLLQAADDQFKVSLSGFPDSSFPNITTGFGINYGDWAHFVVTFGAAGVALYVNGQPHAANGDVPWHPYNYDHGLRIGGDGSRQLDSGGMSHLRCDRGEWTAQEVLDHYDTYFEGAGRGTVEPLFGRQMLIESADWFPRQYSGGAQWRASIVLRELGPLSNYPSLLRQEGGV